MSDNSSKVNLNAPTTAAERVRPIDIAKLRIIDVRLRDGSYFGPTTVSQIKLKAERTIGQGKVVDSIDFHPPTNGVVVRSDGRIFVVSGSQIASIECEQG